MGPNRPGRQRSIHCRSLRSVVYAPERLDLLQGLPFARRRALSHST